MTDTTTVLAEISADLRVVLDEHGLDNVGIERGTRFHEDLELESIDLVDLASRLRVRYGERVNFAEFIAGLDLSEIIELTVGQLTDYVVRSLDA